MQPLEDPASWFLGKIGGVRMSALVATRADMGNIAALLGSEARQIVIIAGIQTQMLRLLCSRRWTRHHERI